MPSIYDRLSEPLTTAPSRGARMISPYIQDPNADPTQQMFLVPRAFLAGATEGAGDVLSNMTSPINLSAMALTGGSSAAARAGLPAISQGLRTGSRVLAAPVAAHGVQTMVDPRSSMSDRAFGLAEAAGGTAGMRPSSRLASSRGMRALLADETGSIGDRRQSNQPRTIGERRSQIETDRRAVERLPKVSDERMDDLAARYAQMQITGKMPAIGMSEAEHARLLSRFGGTQTETPLIASRPKGPMIQSSEISPRYQAQIRSRPGYNPASVIEEMIRQQRAKK
jgi:hypothetical protein